MVLTRNLFRATCLLRSPVTSGNAPSVTESAHLP